MFCIYLFCSICLLLMYVLFQHQKKQLLRMPQRVRELYTVSLEAAGKSSLQYFFVMLAMMELFFQIFRKLQATREKIETLRRRGNFHYYAYHYQTFQICSKYIHCQLYTSLKLKLTKTHPFFYTFCQKHSSFIFASGKSGSTPILSY